METHEENGVLHSSKVGHIVLMLKVIFLYYKPVKSAEYILCELEYDPRILSPLIGY